MTPPPATIGDWSPEEWEMVRKSMHEATQTLDDSLAGILEDARRLGERGWTVPVNQLPEFTPIVVRAVPPEHTDGLFVQLYSRNNAAEFEAMAGELLRKPGLERWQPIIQQCIGGYQRGEHLLVVPCLLAAYEGALASIVDRPHAAKPRALASQKLAAAEGNLERFPWVSIDAFTSTIFMRATFAGERPNLLNRHWVLHGRDAPTWSQADSLRLFQALHTLGSARLPKRADRYEWIRDPVLRQYLREHDSAAS